MFRKIKGQQQVVSLLQNAIEKDRIAQAYIFHGSDGVGKLMTALYFGMAVNCLSSGEFKPCGVCISCHKFLNFEHPDFLYLFPTTNLNMNTDGEIRSQEALKQYEGYLKNKRETPWAEYFFTGSIEIRKESISYLIKKLEFSINEGNFRVVIVENADMMNTQTANAFLKTLEEPPARTIIILITERLPMILPTIISRCQPVYFKPLSQKVVQEMLFDQFQIGSIVAKGVARICGGNFKTAIRIAQDSSNTSRIRAFELLELALQNDGLTILNTYSKSKESYGIDAIQDIISYLGIIANDLAIIKDAPSEITNADKAELLLSIVSDNISERVHGFLLYLDDLSRKLNGNVNPLLVMINLFFSLRDLVSA